MFFPGRAARIMYRVPAKASDAQSLIREIDIGRIGVLHPTVLEKFEIGYPCSALEFTLEPFRKDT
jgi:phenylalanyl-tRNA synthetase beta chain